MWDPVVLDVECIVCNKSLQKINHNIHKPSVHLQNMGKVSNNRRSRTPNWSLDEKQYLLKLIKERKEVVVTKNNNGPNYSEEKDVAWHEILRELSVRFGEKFSAHSIKKVKTQWQNMKRIARDELSLHGQNLQKCSKQTLDVCEILDLVKDGMVVVDRENENQNETLSSNIEVKTEVLDEDTNHPSCSGVDVRIVEPELNSAENRNQFESPASTDSDQVSDNNEYESTLNNHSNMSDRVFNNLSGPKFHSTFLEDISNIRPYHKRLNEFLCYTSTEKKIKLETLREERQVMRAMRETAELNKIIAEQRLKHVLWIKKQEMVYVFSLVLVG